MRLFSLTSFVLLFSALSAFSQDTIVSIAYTSPQPVSYFEDRDTSNYFMFNPSTGINLWQIGTPSKSIFNASYSPSLALVTDTANAYLPNNLSSFDFVVLTDDYTYISFWHRYDTDSLIDGGVVEVSTDNGNTWTNILDSPQFTLINFYSGADSISSNSNKAGFTGSSDWRNSAIEGYALNYVRFRFTFSSGSNPNSREGWMIDNFEFQCFGTGIEDSHLDAKVQLYPNPVRENLHLKLSNGLKLQEMRVYDVKGQIIAQSYENSLSCSQWPDGLYFVEIICAEGRFFRKILK